MRRTYWHETSAWRDPSNWAPQEPTYSDHTKARVLDQLMRENPALKETIEKMLKE